MEGLAVLIKAPSKKVLEQIFVEVFKVRYQNEAPALISDSLIAALKINKQEAQGVRTSN
jgi:hypothetical protein